MIPNTCQIAILWAACVGAQAAEPAVFWFKNEAECAGAHVVVRSSCEVANHQHMVNPHNTLCGEQDW